jgi:hypothetical protein
LLEDRKGTSKKMKLRILDQQLRFRLRKSEVAQFATAGRYSTTSNLAGRTLQYAIESVDAPEAGVQWDGHKLVVHIPRAAANAWTATDQVSWKAQTGGVSVVVEKDFARVHVKSELDYDLYPNPNAKVN